MARDRKDRSGNWLIEHHGDSLLRLAKIDNFIDWKPSPTVLTFPKRTPDGLLDVTFPGRPTPDPFLLEIESYPEQDTYEQVRTDAAMVLLNRGVLPDIVVVVLCRKGNLTINPEQSIESAHGCCELHLKVRVVNLWTIPAEELLSAGDVGLVPWVPLTQFSGTPESLLQLCKDRIEQQAQPREKENLLATTRVMAEMRYNDPQLLGLLGGKPMSMLKIWEASTSAQWFAAFKTREHSRKQIVRMLTKRLGEVPEDLVAHLNAIEDQDRLDTLQVVAMDCADLDAFRTAISEQE